MLRPMTHPTPVHTREDVAAWTASLSGALVPWIRGGGADLGAPRAQTEDRVAGLEGFARPLWGLAALAAGSHDFGHWEVFARGLSRGSDLADEGYWGAPQPRDQRLVELAAIGFALAVAPERFWDPLSPLERQRLAGYLGQINALEVVDNNWHWFPVLVNLGLKRVGQPYDLPRMEEALNRLDGFYRGDGWSSDGLPDGEAARMDYYVPFALHFYALIYAALNGHDDPGRARTYRERAALFAHEFLHWFAEDGAAIPFGRSLTYRFAMGSFWGALAFAGIEALPWGVVKGLYLRHLRWWQRQPITDRAGVLTVGYSYLTPALAEQYTSSGSPYWATKAFLPLALPAEHPFWRAEEQPLPQRVPLVHQPGARVLIGHQPRHSVLFPAGQHALWARHGAEKYAKFAYSSHFAFSIPSGRYGLEQGAFDSTLAVSLDGQHYVPRERDVAWDTGDTGLRVRWRPLPGVEVESWILPVPEGHLRLHRVSTTSLLHTAEGGWCVPLDDALEVTEGTQGVEVRQPGLGSAVYSLVGERQGTLIWPHSNTNIQHPRTALPMLTATLDPGTHWLGCAVIGTLAEGNAPPDLFPSAEQRAAWKGRLADMAARLRAVPSRPATPT